MRKMEVIAAATKSACDAGAHDHPLVSKAHGLIETLFTKRNKLHDATERSDAWKPAGFVAEVQAAWQRPKELHLMHETMKLAVEPPPLPESEASYGFSRLPLDSTRSALQLWVDLPPTIGKGTRHGNLGG
eukprot:Skav216086  [mRNA]  locus=scaffold2042:71914:73008:+ [translate_table: standard]